MKSRPNKVSIKSADNSLNSSLRQPSALHQSLMKCEPKLTLNPPQSLNPSLHMEQEKRKITITNQLPSTRISHNEYNSTRGLCSTSSTSVSTLLNTHALGKLLEKTIKKRGETSASLRENEEDSIVLNNSAALNTTSNSTQIMEEMFPRVLTEIEKSVTLLKKFYDKMVVKKKRKGKTLEERAKRQSSNESTNNTSSTRCNNTVLSS